jgi:surface carbohydrate biosynthesis protein
MKFLKKNLHILSRDGTNVFSIRNDLKEFFLKKNYLFVTKNLFYIYVFFILRKITILYNLIFRVKLHFEDPRKQSFVIYDCELSEEIIKILPNNSYIILSTRINKIKKIFLSKNILIFILKNFFKRSVKQNYLAAVIKTINPKFVITLIDNSLDFYLSAKILNNTPIKFIAIQGAHRITFPDGILKKIFIPEYFCFGKFDQNLYKKKNANINKFNIVGSLRASLCYEFVKLNKIIINKNKYDICLISEPHPYLGGDYRNMKNLADIRGLIAEYTIRLCIEKNLKLIFSGKYKSSYELAELETAFYDYYLKDYQFKIEQSKKFELGTHFNMMQSKLVIGHDSTALREALAFKKKILSCQFIQHKKFFPYKGLSVLSECSYETFKNRVLKILNTSKKEYDLSSNIKLDFVIKNNLNAANIIRQKLI